MKKRFLYQIPFMSLLVVIFTSCKKDESPDPLEVFYDEQVATEVIAEFIDDDIEKLVLNQFFSLHEQHENSGGIIETHIQPNPYTGRIDCASVSINASQDTLTIDFGLGCQAQNSIYRKGKIIAAFSELQNGLTEEISISLVGYKLENIEVNGLRTIVNNTEADFPYSDFTANINSGKLSFTDGTDYTYSSERHVTSSVHGTGNDDDKYTFGVSVNKTGRNREHDSFVAKTELVIGYSSDCFNEGLGQATRGILDLNTNDLKKRMNFNSDNCASSVNVIFPNGEVFLMDLKDLVINN